MRAAALIVSAVLSALLTAACAARSSAGAISALDRALAMRRHYIDIRQQRIDSLKDSYDKKHRTGQLIAIADAYSSFANDSAIT